MENDFKQFVYDKLEIEQMSSVMETFGITTTVEESFNIAWDAHMVTIDEEDFRKYLSLVDKYKPLLEEVFFTVVSGGIVEKGEEVTLQ